MEAGSAKPDHSHENAERDLGDLLERMRWAQTTGDETELNWCIEAELWPRYAPLTRSRLLFGGVRFATPRGRVARTRGMRAICQDVGLDVDETVKELLGDFVERLIDEIKRGGLLDQVGPGLKWNSLRHYCLSKIKWFCAQADTNVHKKGRREPLGIRGDLGDALADEADLQTRIAVGQETSGGEPPPEESEGAARADVPQNDPRRLSGAGTIAPDTAHDVADTGDSWARKPFLSQRKRAHEPADPTFEEVWRAVNEGAERTLLDLVEQRLLPRLSPENRLIWKIRIREAAKTMDVIPRLHTEFPQGTWTEGSINTRVSRIMDVANQAVEDLRDQFEDVRDQFDL